MSRYLLDSDCIIDHLRTRPPAVALLRRLFAQGDDLYVSDVVLAEVYSGLHDRDRARAVELLAGLGFLATAPTAATQAGEWRYRYAREGRALATTDCLIAATAQAHDATLVTGNIRDFPMPELRLLTLR